MFNQVENSSSPILDWDFCIRYKRVVANTVGWYTYNYMPDGHISTLKVRLFTLLSMFPSLKSCLQRQDTGEWYTFYPNHESYRTLGSKYPLPENADRLDPGEKITGGILHSDSYRNGGEWLDAVHPTGRDGAVTGFIHAEDQYWNGQHHQAPYAFKSISLGRCFCFFVRE